MTLSCCREVFIALLVGLVARHRGRVRGCLLGGFATPISQLRGLNTTATYTGVWLPQFRLHSDHTEINSSMLAPGLLSVLLPPAQEASEITVTSPDCAGVLRFQYYDVENHSVHSTKTTLRSSGGSSVNLTFRGLQLIDWTDVSLMLTKTTGNCIGNSMVLSGLYVGNSTVFFRGNNMINDTLCGEGRVKAQYSLNGMQYEVPALHLTIEQMRNYRVLFVYSRYATDFSWTYGQNLGRLNVTATFGLSVETFYAENVSSDVGSVKAVIENYLPLDLVVLASSNYYSSMNPLARIYKNIQFVISHINALASPASLGNVNYVWPTYHESRYIAGVVAGGMISVNGTACYICAYNQPQVISSLNAFTLGVQHLNPYAKVAVVRIDTWGDDILEQEAAKFFFYNRDFKCELLAQHTASFWSQRVFTNGGRFAIGSNSDSRAFVGERVVTSSVFGWGNVYPDIVQMGIDGQLGNQSIVKRLVDTAVGVAGLSGYTSTEVRLNVSSQIQAIIALNGGEYVFCGPIFDTKGVLRVALGKCIAQENLASMLWLVQGTTDYGDLIVPLEKHFKYLGNTERLISISTGILGMVIAVLYGFLMHVWQDSGIIDPSQRRFLDLLLLGCIIALATNILVAMDPSNINCKLRVWFCHVGFCLAFSSLFVQIWKVYISSKNDPSNTQANELFLFKIILTSTTVTIAYLLTWTLFENGPHSELRDCSTTWSATSISTTTCSLYCEEGERAAFSIIIAVAEIIALLYGMSIALRTWHIRGMFYESRWLVLAIYSMLFHIIYVFVLRNFLQPLSESYVVSQIFTTFIAYVVLMNVILVPKLVDVFAGGSKNRGSGGRRMATVSDITRDSTATASSG